MTDLKKLLVIVKSAQHDSFVNTYIKGDSRNKSYDNKIVFLEKTKEIFTQGQIYSSGADLDALKTILADYGASGKRATTVAGDIDAMLTKLSTSNIISLSYTSGSGYGLTETLTLSNTATSVDLKGKNSYSFGSIKVADTKGEFTSASYTYLTNVKGVMQYVTDQIGSIAGGMRFRGDISSVEVDIHSVTGDTRPGDIFVPTVTLTFAAVEGKEAITAEPGDLVIYRGAVSTTKVTLDAGNVTVIERETDTMVTTTDTLTAYNLVLGNGNKTIKTTSYTVGGAEIAAAPTASVLATELAASSYAYNAAQTAQANAYEYTNTKIAALDVTSYELTNNYVKFSYAETDGIVTVSGLTVTLDNPSWDDTTHTLTIPTTGGLLSYSAADALNSYIAYVGGLIDSHDESVTTVTAYVDGSGTHYLTVTDNVTGNDHDYVINAYTKTLGSAVGMTYVNGQWQAADGSITYDGLVTASDVAKEIVDDEKVIAAALNNHERRIKACEEAKPLDGDATGTSNGITTYAYTVAGTIKGVTVSTVNAVLTYASGDITATNASYFMNANGDLNAIKAYAVAQGDAAKAAASAAIEALDTSYTAGTDYAINVSYTETNGIVTSVTATFNADNAIAYTVGTTSYSVSDVAKAVYDPWETFA